MKYYLDPDAHKTNGSETFQGMIPTLKCHIIKVGTGKDMV